MAVKKKNKASRASYYLGNPNLPNVHWEGEYTPEMIQDIQKAKEDVLYFAENFFYIVNPDEGKIKIPLFDFQRDALRMLRDNRFNILLASRQISKTTMLTIYALWVACFNDDKNIVIIANKEATAIEIFRRVRIAYEELPNWIKPGVKEYGKTSAEFANGSRIGISTTTGSAARGQTINVLVADELAHIEPESILEEFWRSVYPTISRAKTSKILIASTPNGTGNLFHKLVEGAEKEENGFVVKRIMWDAIPGRDEEWKSEQIKALGSIDGFLQEFCCSIGATTIDICEDGKFYTTTIEELYNSCTETNKDNFRQSRNVRVYTPDGYKPFVGVQKLNKECLVFSTENHSLTCSRNHPVCTDWDYWNLGAYTQAENLSVCQLIYTEFGFESIRTITPSNAFDVYDIVGVKDVECYYTNGILSHNCVFLNAGDTAIDEALFYHYSQQCQEPVEIRGNMRIYKQPRNGAQYIAGVDIAEGVGEDASVIQIIDISDITNIEQVAVYHNNKISPLEFANVCLETFAEWGNPIALIERNNQGGQVVDRLYYDNNYTQIVSYGAKITGRTKTQMGVISHTNTKSRAVANMRHFVNILKCIKFNDIETVKEFKKFTRQANSTWKAENGYHDDRVMSFIWALMILEKEITEQWFNILKYDDYGKPLMLENLDFGVSKYIDEKSVYNEDDFSRNVSIRPVVFGMGDNEMPSEFFELQQQGWEPLI